jgi:peptidoglycan/LPS O-acetylase OafA/YrhL
VDYRREIGGLRAVAILPVVLFHAGVGLFPGGYVGVVSFLVVQSTTRPTGQAGTGES